MKILYSFLIVWFISFTFISCSKKSESGATCSDGIKNGDETGVDCGGSCVPCPTCNEGIKNGDETGIDCGGSCPNTCAVTNLCTGNEQSKYLPLAINNLWIDSTNGWFIDTLRVETTVMINSKTYYKIRKTQNPLIDTTYTYFRYDASGNLYQYIAATDSE